MYKYCTKQVMDSLDWASDKLNEIQTDCITDVLHTNVTNDDEGNDTLTLEYRTQVFNLVNEIVTNMCPNECNGRGSCANAVCSCETGKYSYLFYVLNKLLRFY